MDKQLMQRLLQIFGSYEKIGAALKTDEKPEGLTKAAVWQWTMPGRNVPAEHCPTLERLSGGLVRCEEMRPDVDWSYLRGTKKAK